MAAVVRHRADDLFPDLITKLRQLVCRKLFYIVRGLDFTEQSAHTYTSPFCILAAVTAFFISIVMVMGPTPPGTGVR